MVLDTHIIIWDVLTPERLSDEARAAVAQADQSGGVILADISLWEIAMMIERQRLHVAAGCQEFITLLLQAYNVHVQAITPQIAALSVQLPPEIGKDPADQLIASTAIAADVPLITADRNLRASDLIATVW